MRQPSIPPPLRIETTKTEPAYRGGPDTLMRMRTQTFSWQSTDRLGEQLPRAVSNRRREGARGKRQGSSTPVAATRNATDRLNEARFPIGHRLSELHLEADHRIRKTGRSLTGRSSSDGGKIQLRIKIVERWTKRYAFLFGSLARSRSPEGLRSEDSRGDGRRKRSAHAVERRTRRDELEAIISVFGGIRGFRLDV